MLFRKTRDIIVETATLVKGVKDSQDAMQKDFKSHISDEDKKIDGLYNVIKECHDTCPESDRFNNYAKETTSALTRIEKKQEENHKETKKTKLQLETRQDDYLKKLSGLGDEVKKMKVEKKTVRQFLGDVAKFVTVLCVIGGLVFGVVKYCEAKKTQEDVKIEKLLKEIIKGQQEGKEKRDNDASWG